MLCEWRLWSFDYYPFGMLQPGRKFSAGNGYRYGFNGKENDNEVKGEGNQQDYGMRIYDGRIGKFLSVDPLTASYPWYTPYQFAGNKPIWASDLDGMEEWMRTQENLLRQRVQLQTQAAESKKVAAAQQALQVMARQPSIGPADNSFYATSRSNYFKRQYDYNQSMNGATMDPLAGSIIHPVANAVGQYSTGVVRNAIGIYTGYRSGNFWEGTKHLGLFALDVLPFIPFKGAGSASRIFSTSIETRGLAEEFAVTNDVYQGFSNANKTIKPGNFTYDLYSFEKSTMVDVTTTTGDAMNISQLYRKLNNLSSSKKPFENRILQVYVPEGRYSATEISQLENKLQSYITDYQLKSTFRVSQISNKTASLPLLPAGSVNAAQSN